MATADQEREFEAFLEEERNLTRMVCNRVEKYGGKVALRHKPYGQWESYTWKEFGENINLVAKALLEWGVSEQEMVGIFSQNRAEWSIADLGIQSVRGVSVPVYATNSAEEVDYIINDAKIRVIFVNDQEQYDKVLSLVEKSLYLKKIVVFDRTVDISGNHGVHFDDFLTIGRHSARDAEVGARRDAIGSDDLATLIYTSGTTGNPKGVMLTHRNFLAMLCDTGYPLPLGEKDVNLCFLPLSHVFERAWTYFIFCRGAENHYCIDTKKLLEYFQEVRPHYMTSVPRVWEKVHATLMDKLEESSPTKRKLFNWALNAGEAYYSRTVKGLPVSLGVKVKHALARKLVLSKIQDLAGGRCRSFNVGGAPFSADINRFFFNAGVMLAQGYGLTECFPICVTNPTHIKFGTCGPVTPLTQLRISEDGEIQAKGPSLMKGYYGKPEETAALFTPDGWLRTGDIGHIDDDGYVVITDRIKELIITSGGKNISPLMIETLLKEDLLIEQAVAIGDGRKYISALIVPSFGALENWAREKGLTWETRAELIALPEVVKLFEERVAHRTEPLGQVEKVKSFNLLERELTQEAGELTPTSKLKRRVINETFFDVIESMYKD